MKTRCKDKNGDYIYEGDILHVEEYPGKYVGGSLNFEGLVTIEDGKAMITYLDIGESESYPISMFPKEGREIYPEKWRYNYWRSLYLGGKPPAELWKTELYRQHFDTKEKGEKQMTKEDLELKEARDECVRLGLLQKQGKNLNGTDTYVKTEKGERIFKELLEDAKRRK